LGVSVLSRNRASNSPTEKSRACDPAIIITNAETALIWVFDINRIFQCESHARNTIKWVFCHVSEL
jgi:hypothetical protein